MFDSSDKWRSRYGGNINISKRTVGSKEVTAPPWLLPKREDRGSTSRRLNAVPKAPHLVCF